MAAMPADNRNELERMHQGARGRTFSRPRPCRVRASGGPRAPRPAHWESSFVGYQVILQKGKHKSDTSLRPEAPNRKRACKHSGSEEFLVHNGRK